MNNRKKAPSLVVLVVFICAVCLIVVNRTNLLDTAMKPKVTLDGDVIAVHYLDVGQGDSEFIELPNDKCMLIDAGVADSSELISSRIEELGYSTIDYVVATHPHADHIGGMASIIDDFDIGEIYMPKVSSNSKTFENLLETISDNGYQINTAKAGTVIYSDDELNMEFLSPVSSTYSETNNYSCVLKITYGDNSFLFTGDAEELVEKELLEHSYNLLSADVLKVGHHGSRYSSSSEFLKAVRPSYAVISCSADNSYGHPHNETIERLYDIGADIYRTDESAEVLIACDGKNRFEVVTER